MANLSLWDSRLLMYGLYIQLSMGWLTNNGIFPIDIMEFGKKMT